MTLTQQIAVLRKVAKLDKSKAEISFSRYGGGSLDINIHQTVSGKNIKRIYAWQGGDKVNACIGIQGYDKIIRVLDKMIAQYKEMAK